MHLIHEVILPEPVEETPSERVDDDSEDHESSIPSVRLLAVLAISMSAAIAVQRKQQ